MPGGNEFDKIGDRGEIDKLDYEVVCSCCRNEIPKQEKCLIVDLEFSDDYTFVCKNCVRLAAKRMGLLR